MEDGTSRKTDSKNFKGGPPVLPSSPFIQQNSMVATEPHPCLSQSSSEDMRAHQSAASSDSAAMVKVSVCPGPRRASKS